MYNCQTPSCALALSKAVFPMAMNCPVCQTPLSEIIELNESFISTEDNELLQKLPYVIAYPLQQTLLEKNATQRLNYLRDSIHNYLKYLALLSASEFFNSSFRERKIVDLFFKNLIKPSFGNWNAFTRDCILFLKTQKHTFFCPDLAEYYETVEIGKKRKMYKGEIEVVDSYNGGETRYKEQQVTGIGMLINFRNRLHHNPTIDTATSQKFWNDYFPIFKTLLEQLTFCEKFPMLKKEAAVYYSLQGIEIKPFESNITIDSNVSIYNRATNSSMPIIPFFIIPGELAIESDEKANIMSYESNNGKTITFFSPEGITKQTSGKLLERLNLLLRDKQKEIPFTPETFTKELFAERISEENQLMLKSLLNEKKVIEGIYQHREEMEIKLREWIGARANIFFIAAESGSGKTNLLVEIQKQYAERNLTSLLIRASRMEKPSLKEELCYQLNMDYSLDTAQYNTMAGTQSEPTFILIDGLNESSNAESIWLEILEISCAFEPGSLKFIITSRANTKTDLDRYVISEDQMQYLYGENKDHETGLGAYAFWLTPLDMKEMESAWESYVAKDKNRFKPLFSFNDIATFDRGLYLQINNPLVLRIFLETYKGKNLPKKETKHLHVWKDWFVTFSNEEQKFMSLLAEAVWELGENELLLDTVLNNKNLQSYFLNDTTNAPYQRLLTLGWISRYVKDLTVYVSFTVEGLLFYLLGTKLNQQNPIITTATIDEILTNGTKLQKSAIEAFLCEQALEGKIELIAQLIDEGEEKLELCVTPLLYFLKSQGVEKTIEKLLENPTENDWKALLELDSRLYNLQLNLIRKDFLTKVMSQNQFQTKEAVWLGLNAIALFDKEKAMFYLSKIDTSANFIQTDNDLLFLLGNCEYTFGNYNKSLEYYEKCLSIELKDLGDEHPAVATSYNGIGMTYHNKGKYDKALEYFEKSMVLRLKKLGSEFQNVAKSYNNIGGAWEGKGEYDKALKYHKKCLEIRLKTLGSEHPDVATSYNNIGMSCHKKGDYNEALEYFEKSVTIFLKTLDCEHPNVATSYNNIGLTWKYKCEYDKALEYYEKCLSILLKTLGEEHPSVATSYNNIGLTWKLKGEFDKALEYYEKCIAIRLKTLGKEHPSFASSYNNIGGIWGSKSEYDKALENYEKCLVILLKTFGGEHPDVATSYNNIGNTWKDKGEYDKALKFYEMSLAIYSKVFGWEHPNIALSYSNIGGILNLKGKYDKALEYFEKCLAIELKTLGSKHSDVATSYFNIANCYYELKNYQCAIDKYKKGFITSRKGGFPFQIAQCYEELNEKENALDYYIQSAGIRKEDPVVGLEADATQEAIANAKRLAVELGKEEDLPKWMN